MTNHVEIMHNAVHCPTPPSTTIVHTSHALMGMTNTEFSMLHVALPNASTAQRRTAKYVWYASVHLVHHASRGGSMKWCAMGMPIPHVYEFHTSVLFHHVQRCT